MNYIDDHKNVKGFVYLCVVMIVLGAGTIWFKPLETITGIIVLVIGLISYGAAIKKAFDSMLSGGEDRFLEIFENKTKENAEEFAALESMYLIVKPISLRLPVEVCDYKLLKIHAKEEELLAQAKEREDSQ